MDRIKTEVRKLFHKAKQTENWPRYKTALPAYSNVIRETNRNRFRELCEGIEQTIEVSRLYKTKAKVENEDARVDLLPRNSFLGSFPIFCLTFQQWT